MTRPDLSGTGERSDSPTNPLYRKDVVNPDRIAEPAEEVLGEDEVERPAIVGPESAPLRSREEAEPAADKPARAKDKAEPAQSKPRAAAAETAVDDQFTSRQSEAGGDDRQERAADAAKQHAADEQELTLTARELQEARRKFVSEVSLLRRKLGPELQKMRRERQPQSVMARFIREEAEGLSRHKFEHRQRFGVLKELFGEVHLASADTFHDKLTKVIVAVIAKPDRDNALHAFQRSVGGKLEAVLDNERDELEAEYQDIQAALAKHFAELEDEEPEARAA